MLNLAFAQDYIKLASGSVGRLIIALAYFLVAANVLSLADFGFFATTSAMGVILSRVAGLGFMSPLFRAATIRPRIMGAYLTGFLIAFAVSLPVVALMGWLIHALLLNEMPWQAFALVIVAEVIGWRMLEVVSNINNGLRQFGRASTLVLLGSLIRTLVALGFWYFGQTTLLVWAVCYCGANLAAAALAWSVFLPKSRLRYTPALYVARGRDALSSGIADLIFFVQAELDKAVVLLAAGPRIAGMYAIAMRLIDITAMPVRVFNQLAMQKVMTDRGVQSPLQRLVFTELTIAAVSVAALAVLIAALWWHPALLGSNVATASVLFPLMIAVPAFRNLIEYHAEVLYGMERTELRALLLAIIAILKALMIGLAIALSETEFGWAIIINGIFMTLYALSAMTVYTAISAARRSV